MSLSRSKIEIYDLTQSPFFRLGSQRRLAKLVRMDLPKLRNLAADKASAYWTRTEVINGKTRNIACPVGAMRKLHENLKGLFNRIRQPEYLYSPRRKRSAPMNAAAHVQGHVSVNLDIRQFYPSTDDEHVFQFLHHRLAMTPDVAGLLTKLVTFNGRIPFGSPLSPVLCTLVHRDMFDRIGSACSAANQKMTLWVDDLTVSGSNVPDSQIFAVRGEIAKKGFRSHKVRRRRVSRGATITGAFISRDGLAPANKIHLKIRDGLAALGSATDTEERLKIIRSLIGLHNHCATVYSEADPVAKRFLSRKAWLHAQRRLLEDEASKAPIAAAKRIAANCEPTELF